MKLRMLTGLAGIGFSVAPREITDRFDGREAHNLIGAGYAEEVPDEVPEKTAEEWTAEIAALFEQLEEGVARERLLADETTASAAEIAALFEQLEEGVARERLLADETTASAAEIAALTERMDAAKHAEAELIEQLNAAKAAAEAPILAPKGKGKGVVKETAEKLPVLETRG